MSLFFIKPVLTIVFLTELKSLTFSVDFGSVQILNKTDRGDPKVTRRPQLLIRLLSLSPLGVRIVHSPFFFGRLYSVRCYEL